MQRIFLVLFTLSAICTTSHVVFLGKMIRVPLLGDSSDERIPAIGGNASPGERGTTPVSIEPDEVNSIEQENPSRKNEDKLTQNTMRRLLKLGNKTEGPKNSVADEEAAKATAKATIAAEEAAKSVAAVAEEAAKAVAAAAEEAAKAIAAATAADPNIAVKVDREQIRLINDNEAEKVSAAIGCRC